MRFEVKIMLLYVIDKILNAKIIVVMDFFNGSYK